MIFSNLQEQLVRAMKAHDAVEVGTIRMVLSAVKNVAIDKYGVDADTKVSEADVLDVIKKQVKTHKESIEAFTKADRLELAKKEQAELDILSKYLPMELSDEDLRAIVSKEVLASTGIAYGPLMGKVMAAVKGQAGGDRVSSMLKSLL